jgi:arginine/lysine/histidine transporter system substrate-binding protein
MKKVLFLIIVLALAAISLGIIIYLPFSAKPETNPELQEIKSRGKIIVGTEAEYPPMEFIDDDGNFAGIDIDIAKEIAKDLGAEAEFRHILWQDIFDALLAEEVDMVISAVTILPERAEIMAFSSPYFNAGQIIVVAEGNAENIQSTNNLDGKTIGVQEDTTSHFEAKKLTAEVAAYVDYNEAREDLLAGKLDAIIIDYPAGIELARTQEGLKIVGEPFTNEFYGVAVRKENQALLAKINNTLMRLKKSSDIGKIINKWLEAK